MTAQYMSDGRYEWITQGTKFNGDHFEFHTSGTYTLDGDKLTITPMKSDRSARLEPFTDKVNFSTKDHFELIEFEHDTFNFTRISLK